MSARATVLVIEDEPALASVLVDNLEAEGFAVRWARDGLDGEQRWIGGSEGPPDLVVLDVMLPKLDGFELCERMRALGDDTPVLFLSARGQAEDRVRGLHAGADDYLAKPFHLPEFLLRVRAMLRRRGWRGDAGARYAFAGNVIDFRSWMVETRAGAREALGERELGILRLLTSRAGEVVPRDDILDEVWGDDAFPSSRTVDNVVVRLRRIIENDPSNPVHIHTVWGVGYRFTPDPETEVGAPSASPPDDTALDDALDSDAPDANSARDLEGGGA
ncbi:MAG: DNA-binding response regulator [Trueperaceae bacterium]|nr:MAG: DNA-binding response regulator [Trueperaceae bacterium]